MPVCPAEPTFYPAQLFADAGVPEREGRNWWVVHTRPRQEKSLARQLLQKKVPFFLPVVGQRSFLRNRVVTAHIPLFSSYLFLLGNDKERLAALTTNRIVQTLPVVDQQQMWFDLDQIQRLIESGAPIRPEDQLVAGALVEIQSGPLAGLKGKILRTAAGKRFVVQVDFIQRGASVELDEQVLTRMKE